MDFQYVRSTYGVPAEAGRRIVMDGKPGIIVEDRGHHLGVNFDADPIGRIVSVHPTWEMQYGEMGTVRRLRPAQERSQARYRRFLEYGDAFSSFLAYCRWDAQPERSWNAR